MSLSWSSLFSVTSSQCIVIFSDLTRSIEELSVKISAASRGSDGTEERIQDLVDRVDNIQEKMYDFEINKRNNLLFYGIKEERRETPSDLFNKVRNHWNVVFNHTIMFRFVSSWKRSSTWEEILPSAQHQECSLAQRLEDAGNKTIEIDSIMSKSLWL